MSQWIGGTAQDPEPRVRAVRIRDGALEPGEELPAEPLQFAIDHRCHEWFVSETGALFERAGPAKGWRKVELGPLVGQPGSSAIATVGDRVWASIGTALYVVRAGKAEKVELPVALTRVLRGTEAKPSSVNTAFTLGENCFSWAHPESARRCRPAR